MNCGARAVQTKLGRAQIASSSVSTAQVSQFDENEGFKCHERAKAANSRDYTDEGGPRANRDARITQCQADTGIYCCGSNVTDSVCCENGFRIEQGQAKAVNATSTSSTRAAGGTTSASSTGSTSSTLTGTASPSPTPPLPPKPHTNIGAAVGGAVGGVAAIAIIGALWFLFARRRRRSASTPTAEEPAGWTSKLGHRNKDSKSYGLDAVAAGKSVHEVDGFQRVEIDGQTMPPELEGNKRQIRPGELE